MTVQFIVLGLPRSATTWMANWLTTDNSLCLHDPFAYLHPDQLGSAQLGQRLLGISCTGAFLMPWLRKQKCPVLIIEREHSSVGQRLLSAGLPDLTKSPWFMDAFSSCAGLRVAFDELWNEATARKIWAFLLPTIPFDSARYNLLVSMKVEPTEAGLSVDMALARRLVIEGELPYEVLGGVREAI